MEIKRKLITGFELEIEAILHGRAACSQFGKKVESTKHLYWLLDILCWIEQFLFIQTHEDSNCHL